ncbi:serine protease, partial [uncultured Ruegeria sp.]|uniref:serine protease n=1 Tax=uncultured Ruegeria sp. TaxID=259304 RepID=UPI00261653F7
MPSKVYCQLHQAFEEDQRGKQNHIISAISEIQSRTVAKKKDFWDKISASATLISGLLIGLIGIFATATYNNRELASQRADQEASIQVRRVEIVQKFFPHLVSREGREQKGALLSIASLGDGKLATELAQNFASAASVDALRQLAGSSDPKIARQATAALDATILADSLLASTVRITVSSVDEEGSPTIYDGTGFIVSSQGYVVTASHVVPDSNRKEISVSLKGESQNAIDGHVIQIDRLRDVALIRLKLDPATLPEA